MRITDPELIPPSKHAPEVSIFSPACVGGHGLVSKHVTCRYVCRVDMSVVVLTVYPRAYIRWGSMAR